MANKKTKIIFILFGLLIIITAVLAIYFGGGSLFKGSIIAETKTKEAEGPIECGPHNSKGLTFADEPYEYWGISDEACSCDSGANWTVNPSLPSLRNCGEDGVSACLRLENEQKPCVCEFGYTEENFACVPVEQPSGPCVFTTPEIDYCIPGGQCIENAHLEQNRCQCDDGYEFKDGKCEAISGTPDTSNISTKSIDSGINKSYVDVSDRFQSATDIITKVAKCPDSSMDANCICPDDSYYDSVNEECVEITCDFDKQHVSETYMHNTESYDHTSPAGRAKIEDYYKAQDSYLDECVTEEEETSIVEETAEEEEAAVVEEATEEELTEEEAVVEEESAPLSCDQLFAILSQAFHDLDWGTYESTMEALDEDECLGYCESRFYWAIMYISLRDAIAARLYYDDENCTSCVMYNALASYAADVMSGYDDFIETDAQMLKELLETSLDYCESPGDLQEFKNSLEFDESMFFTYKDEKPKAAGLIGSLIPTAYAQSDNFSDDVDSVIEEVYNDKFTLPEPEAPPTVAECRSLEIVKPDAAKGDQPTILVPLSGYINEQLAIQVDTDPDAVSLYRYKSLEATITFDNQGHIYDTIKTSVVMNHTDTSKGDIVTVWALDSNGEGIQSCHDSFVVQINTPEPPPVTAAPVTTTYVPPVTAAPVSAPVTAAPQVQYVVAAPTTQTLYHNAAVPGSPANGPGVLLYFAGAGIGGVLLRRRKRK